MTDRTTSIPLSFPPALLLLADSALPLGSFAFSSGLESCLAHRATISNGSNVSARQPAVTTTTPSQAAIPSFLSLSLLSIACTMVPYLVAAYHDPDILIRLDNDLDASTTCTVARRASIAQGRALLSVWEKAFKNAEPAAVPLSNGTHGFDKYQSTFVEQSRAREALDAFCLRLKTPTTQSATAATAARPSVNGHLAPLFGITCLSQSLSINDTVWVFLFNHARAVLSAAVRAGVIGPYQSQAILASVWLRDLLMESAQRGMSIDVENAGQCVPVMDIWGGRHELLYTRIFNS